LKSRKKFSTRKGLQEKRPLEGGRCEKKCLATRPRHQAQLSKPYFLLSCSSSSLHDGAHTAWALPNTFLVPIMERGLCLPHMKHDIVALPKEVVATKGEPDTLDL
jgi:hypothetical protein